jgi:hypothetical protein
MEISTNDVIVESIVDLCQNNPIIVTLPHFNWIAVMEDIGLEPYSYPYILHLTLQRRIVACTPACNYLFRSIMLGNFRHSIKKRAIDNIFETPSCAELDRMIMQNDIIANQFKGSILYPCIALLNDSNLDTPRLLGFGGLLIDCIKQNSSQQGFRLSSDEEYDS